MEKSVLEVSVGYCLLSLSIFCLSARARVWIMEIIEAREYIQHPRAKIVRFLSVLAVTSEYASLFLLQALSFLKLSVFSSFPCKISVSPVKG